MSTQRLSSRIKKDTRPFDPLADTDVEMKVAASGTKVMPSCADKQNGSNGPSASAGGARQAAKSSSSRTRKKSIKSKKTRKRKIKSKKTWNAVEDERLREIVTKRITKNKPIRWMHVAEAMEGDRNGKQCRERWLDHLRPGLKKSAWTQEEEDLLVKLQSELGNQWTKISTQIGGRSQGDVKNRWISLLKRSSLGRPDTTSKAKPSPVSLADATNTPHKMSAKAISITNTKKPESNVQPTSPLMMTPGIGSTRHALPPSPSPPAKPAARDFDPSPASKRPVPELGLPTIEFDDTLAASDDVTHPHFFAAMKDIGAPTDKFGDDGVIAALLSSLSPNTTRDPPPLSSSDSKRSPEMISLDNWQGPPTHPTVAVTNSAFAMESIIVPSPDISQSSAPANYQIVENGSRGLIAFI